MTATYRLQLRPDFPFAAAEALLPYLVRLGISHLYLSPVTEARHGSTHGYDVIDHNAVRAEFGGREGLDQLMDACHAAGLGVVFDWVPNHAGVGPRNEAWQDTLAYGPASPWAQRFDIDWDPLKPELVGKVLLPFLGQPYGDALEANDIRIAYDDGRFYAAYYDDRFALSPHSYAELLTAALPTFERAEPYWDLKDLADAYRLLDPDERDKAEALRPRLAAWAAAGHFVWLDHLGLEAVHAVLEQQRWRLSFWGTAGYEINYRRFFDINSLVGLRMESPQVFWETHRLLGQLLAHPAATGVRIDHIDGLFDPHTYLERLRDLGARHVWVEKILSHGETLPDAWVTEGTTGYGFTNDVLHLQLPPGPDAEAAVDRAYRRFVPEAASWDRTARDSKRLVMETALQSELFHLATDLDRISEADYRTRDFTLEALREALEETVAAFDRYRTYLPHNPENARLILEAAIQRAIRANPALEPSTFHFLKRAVLGDVRADLQDEQRAWTGRFQQYTAPVTAKGVEDTAFYRFLRLTALCEVGGEPERWALEPDAFHAHARFRALRYPNSLLATATHDHKRGEDTRTRLAALAAVPDLWEETARALTSIGERHTSPLATGPSPADAYLFFQTLAALWPERGQSDPPLADRLWTYAQKAAREAKLCTSWIHPDSSYETALETFVRGVTADPGTEAALTTFSSEIARLGFGASVTQLVLKLTTPGVPDFYQGTEWADFSLVDPDNRRPVDYEAREADLEALSDLIQTPESDSVRALLDSRTDQSKLFVTARLLRFRQAHGDIFAGGYRALEVEGPGADGWLAFAREPANEADGAPVLVIVPRHFGQRPDGEAAVLVPAEHTHLAWRCVLTGHEAAPCARIDVATLPLPWSVLAAAT